jgi:phosphoribosylformimino-5-aminoimidazole carboxamide ribotide isomerase
MMTGPNTKAIEEMVRTATVPVIASGGISSLHDIERLTEIEGLWGAITGKALYEGSLDLREAIKIGEDSHHAR